MTEKNKAIFKEFLRLKWVEIRWVFVIIPIIYISFLAGKLSFNLSGVDITDNFDICVATVMGFFILIMLTMIISGISMWIIVNLEKAKKNVEKNLKIK